MTPSSFATKPVVAFAIIEPGAFSTMFLSLAEDELGAELHRRALMAAAEFVPQPSGGFL